MSPRGRFWLISAAAWSATWFCNKKVMAPMSPRGGFYAFCLCFVVVSWLVLVQGAESVVFPCAQGLSAYERRGDSHKRGLRHLTHSTAITLNRHYGHSISSHHLK